MIALAGGAGRLPPHVKTHKLAAWSAMHLRHGIRQFKCATIAEAEMRPGRRRRGRPARVSAGRPRRRAADRARAAVPQTRFSVIADERARSTRLARAAAPRARRSTVLVDLDVGMHRTGIAPGPRRARSIDDCRASGARRRRPARLRRPHARRATGRAHGRSDAAFAAVESLRNATRTPRGWRSARGRRRIADISRARPASRRRAEPGTTVLWDAGYGTSCRSAVPAAAVLLTRVVSKPGGQRVCLDLGHKAVASENPHPRVQLIRPAVGT